MAIEPHSSSLKKVLQNLQELISKLENVDHEQLNNLLGGDTTGHYHLTLELLNKLVNIPATGVKGDKGEKGDPFTYEDFTAGQLASLKGEKGEKGDKGDAFTFSDFTPEQLASLKGEKGDKGDPGTSAGKGEKGDNGEAATIEIGTVTTGAAGTSASVTNSGTRSNAIFNFVIPRGDKGETGTQGPSGSSSGSNIIVENTLASTSTTNALSAYQGNILNQKINQKIEASALTGEEWTFTLEDGSTVVKKVALMS